MNITSAEFVKGIKGTDKILYDGKLQVAFVGRSNVGKSSLINSLVNRNNLARSSSQPGKTVRLDFFLINNSFYFVDLPGYGFAKFSQEKHEDIRKMMLWYLEYSEVERPFIVHGQEVRCSDQKDARNPVPFSPLARSGTGVKRRKVVLIIDAVVGITEFDRQMIEVLTAHNIDFVIAANKVDKLKAGERDHRLKTIQHEAEDTPVIAYSAKTKVGKGEVLKYIFH